MPSKPVVFAINERVWESWCPKQSAAPSGIYWKTLLSSEKTTTNSLALGLTAISPHEQLPYQQHQQPKCYVVLEGDGWLEIDGYEYTVSGGWIIFIPSNAAHALVNTGDSALRFLSILPVDSFQEVE